MNPLSDVMGGWGIWETVNGEQKLTTECIENVIMMVPFSAIVMWTFGKKIGNSWKKILWQSGKIAFIFSVSINKNVSPWDTSKTRGVGSPVHTIIYVRIIHDHKLEALEDLIEAANGQPVLVAYWFKHDRQRIMEHLAKQRIPVRDIKSSTDIRDWNAGNIPVALIHPASAGHGLNIQQGGHILIWFGLTWSLELYQQTNARLWRQGQTDVVTIHHIITKDTVDEDVMAALEQKDMTQEKLISAVKAQLGR